MCCYLYLSRKATESMMIHYPQYNINSLSISGKCMCLIMFFILRVAKKANNVWGAVLTEETLTSDLIGVGVGKRNLKELDSDRGAETYDYIMAAEVNDKETTERQRREEEMQKSSLDQELVKNIFVNLCVSKACHVQGVLGHLSSFIYV